MRTYLVQRILQYTILRWQALMRALNVLFKFEMHFLRVRSLTKQQLLNLAQQSYTRREMFFTTQYEALKDYGLFE